MKTWITLLISVPIGAISSLIAWWILNYCIKPKVTFSEDISRTFEDTKSFYRFKFENSGKRKIVDVEAIAKLRIKGLKYTTNWEVIYLPLDNSHIPIIRSVKKEKEKLRELLRLELGLIGLNYFRFLPVNITDKITDDSITLEELMNLGTEAELILIISGYDEISGAKKTFEYKYQESDIKDGIFNRTGLNVVL